MKIKTLTAAIMLCVFSAIGANAQSVVYEENTNISFREHNLSEIKTMTAEDAAIDITFLHNARDYTSYNVFYRLNDGREQFKTVNAGTYEIAPSKEQTVTIPLTGIKNGIYELEMWVEEGSQKAAEFSEKIYIMDKTAPQFMGKYNNMGVVTLLNHKKDTAPWTSDVFKYIDYAGIKSIRQNMSYTYSEEAPGKYNFPRWTGWYVNEIKKRDMNWYANENTIRNFDDPDRAAMKLAKGLRSQSVFEAQINRTLEMIKYGNVKNLSFFNEPNLAHLWDSAASKVEYPNLVKQTYLAVKDQNPDINFVAFELAHRDAENYLDECLKNGIYPYIDTISTHPYVNSSDMEAGDDFENKLRISENAVLKYGGWKETAVGEYGVYNSNSVDDFTKGTRILKEQIAGVSHDINDMMVFDLVSTGLDPNNPEHTYGILEYDLMPKRAYIALGAYNRLLSGSEYVGRIDLNIDNTKTYAFVFLKDGEPIMFTWAYLLDGSSAEFDLGDESAEIIDFMGNTIAREQNHVDLCYDPYYIKGLSNKWIRRAVRETVSKQNNDWTETYGNIDPEITEKAEAVFRKAEADLSADTDAKEIFDAYEKLGVDIISSFKAGNISDIDASKMTFELQKSLRRLAGLCMSEYDGELRHPSEKARNDAHAKRAARYADKGSNMKYSEAICVFADKFYEKACDGYNDSVYSAGKAAMVYGNDLMATALYKWFDEFSSGEERDDYYRFFISADGLSSELFSGLEQQVQYDLVNKTDREITGHVEVYDADGEKIAENPPITVKPGHYIKQDINILFYAEDSESEKQDIYFRFIDGSGKTVVNQHVGFNIASSLEVSVLNCTEEIDKLKEVKLKLKNNESGVLPIHLDLSGSDDLILAADSLDVELDPQEERTISVPIKEIRHNQYHYYHIGWTAKKGDAVVSSGTKLLGFNIAVKAHTPMTASEFTGDISDWQDAYPIYAAQPKDASSKEAWEELTVAARALTKWDEENLYLLVDVYDNKHYQGNLAANLWQGDSIQIGIDALGDGAQSFKSDDYEVGVALHMDNILTSYCWSGNGDMSNAEEITKIIRNNQTVTRYFIKLSKKNIPQMKLVEDGTLSFEIAVNDGDVLNREAYIQFFGGIAAGKNPSLFGKFKLVDRDAAAYSESKATDIFAPVY